MPGGGGFAQWRVVRLSGGLQSSDGTGPDRARQKAVQTLVWVGSDSGRVKGIGCRGRLEKEEKHKMNDGKMNDAKISFARAPYFAYSDLVCSEVGYPLIDAALAESDSDQSTLPCGKHRINPFFAFWP